MTYHLITIRSDRDKPLLVLPCTALDTARDALAVLLMGYRHAGYTVTPSLDYADDWRMVDDRGNRSAAYITEITS